MGGGRLSLIEVTLELNTIMRMFVPKLTLYDTAPLPFVSGSIRTRMGEWPEINPYEHG